MSAEIAEATILKKFVDLMVKEIADKTKKVIVSLFRFSPSKFSKTTLKRASTTNTNYPELPDIVFDNPKNVDVTIKEISLVPDADFRTMGSVIIKIDDDDILFESKEDGNFTNMLDSKIIIPEGRTLKRDEKINVFMKTSTTIIYLTVQITLGD